VTEAGADTVATACPFCLGMLEDAARSGAEAPPRVADLAELVAAGLVSQTSAAANAEKDESS
jgi:Fe-S oxidoreductase